MVSSTIICLSLTFVAGFEELTTVSGREIANGERLMDKDATGRQHAVIPSSRTVKRAAVSGSDVRYFRMLYASQVRPLIIRLDSRGATIETIDAATLSAGPAETTEGEPSAETPLVKSIDVRGGEVKISKDAISIHGGDVKIKLRQSDR
ncbi:MAG: hypothetical protein ACYC3X_29155 [Pirellulaceae bacterium]